MSVQLPEKPWTKGDSFKVDETGLTYVWSGEAWLSDGAELPDDLATVDFVAANYIGNQGKQEVSMAWLIKDDATTYLSMEPGNKFGVYNLIDPQTPRQAVPLGYFEENVFSNMTKTVHLRQPSDAVKINCSDPSSYSPQDSEKDILQGSYKTNGGSRSTWSFGFNKLREYWLYCWDMGNSNCGMTWIIKGSKKFTIDTNGAKMASAFIMKPHDMSGVDEGDYEKASMAAVEIDIGHRLRELKIILVELKASLSARDADVRESLLKALENVEKI